MTLDSKETVVADEFPARLFPASFTVLYCPVDGCAREEPYHDPEQLIEHMDKQHGWEILNSGAVLPYLDRYLREKLSHPEEDDVQLRERLQRNRLEEILALQETERNTTHKRGRHCLFCNTHWQCYSSLFSHMFSQHGFNIGQLDNLILVEEFLDRLQAKLDDHICILCEKQFPSMPILKKHLKNKNHYKIHPQNHQYDKYYIVNYIGVGRLYDEREDTENEPIFAVDSVRNGDGGGGDDDDKEWSELADVVDQRTACLLCSEAVAGPEEALHHMRHVHDFDWLSLTEPLDEYDRIKLVNYFRTRFSSLACPFCMRSEESEIRGNQIQTSSVDDTLESLEKLCVFSLKEEDSSSSGEDQKVQAFVTETALLEHVHAVHDCLLMPDRSLWKDPRYLFPFDEADPLLCFLDQQSVL